jgi:hypothetical protein
MTAAINKSKVPSPQPSHSRGLIAGGFHFPFPAFGSITPSGNGYQFVPVA